MFQTNISAWVHLNDMKEMITCRSRSVRGLLAPCLRLWKKRLGDLVGSLRQVVTVDRGGVGVGAHSVCTRHPDKGR